MYGGMLRIGGWDNLMMDISRRPQGLSVEARHTLSLEAAKKRRLKVANESSLFLPRNLISFSAKVPDRDKLTMSSNSLRSVNNSKKKIWDATYFPSSSSSFYQAHNSRDVPSQIQTRAVTSRIRNIQENNTIPEKSNIPGISNLLDNDNIAGNRNICENENIIEIEDVVEITDDESTRPFDDNRNFRRICNNIFNSDEQVAENTPENNSDVRKNVDDNKAKRILDAADDGPTRFLDTTEEFMRTNDKFTKNNAQDAKAIPKQNITPPNFYLGQNIPEEHTAEQNRPVQNCPVQENRNPSTEQSQANIVSVRLGVRPFATINPGTSISNPDGTALNYFQTNNNITSISNPASLQNAIPHLNNSTIQNSTSNPDSGLNYSIANKNRPQDSAILNSSPAENRYPIQNSNNSLLQKYLNNISIQNEFTHQNSVNNSTVQNRGVQNNSPVQNNPARNNNNKNQPTQPVQQPQLEQQTLQNQNQNYLNTRPFQNEINLQNSVNYSTVQNRGVPNNSPVQNTPACNNKNKNQPAQPVQQPQLEQQTLQNQNQNYLNTRPFQNEINLQNSVNYSTVQNRGVPNVSSVPVQFSSVPVQVSSLPVQVSSVPVQVSSVPVQVSSVPVQVSSVPVQVSSVPAQVSSIPVQVSSVPVQKKPARNYKKKNQPAKPVQQPPLEQETSQNQNQYVYNGIYGPQIQQFQNNASQYRIPPQYPHYNSALNRPPMQEHSNVNPQQQLNNMANMAPSRNTNDNMRYHPYSGQMFTYMPQMQSAQSTSSAKSPEVNTSNWAAPINPWQHNQTNPERHAMLTLSASSHLLAYYDSMREMQASSFGCGMLQPLWPGNQMLPSTSIIDLALNMMRGPGNPEMRALPEPMGMGNISGPNTFAHQHSRPMPHTSSRVFPDSTSGTSPPYVPWGPNFNHPNMYK